MSDVPQFSAELPTPDAAQRFSHHAMNCDWGIIIAGSDARAAQAAAQAAFDEVDRVEQELSRFRPRSDISRLNLMPPGEPVRVGPAAWECLALARDVWEKTGGAFDVTIGAALKRDTATNDRPPPIGMQHLHLDRETRSAVRLLEGLVIDLGAIGKGFGVDQAVETLREWGIGNALVHSGQSTLFAFGTPPGQCGWSLAIRDPRDHAKALGHVTLRDQAFSGSGVLLHGPHIIDPRCGAAAMDKLAAWAIAPSAALSDAISTAFMVMTPGEIEATWQSWPGVSALVAFAAESGLALRCFGLGWPGFP